MYLWKPTNPEKRLIVKKASEIDNAIYIHSNRFVECADGVFIDLEESDKYSELYPTSEVLEKLNSTCGIWMIDNINYDYLIDIYAKDGTLYTVNEIHPNLHAALYEGSYEEYFESDYFLEKEERVSTSAYEKENIQAMINERRKREYVAINTYDVYDVFLNDDGTVSCDYYPEVSEWKDVVEIRAFEEILIALTSDGKTLSAGTSFNHENIVKIDITDNYGSTAAIPIALTADGRLIIGDYPGKDWDLDSAELNNSEKEYYRNIKKVITQAETFTDVVDFYADTNPYYIIVLKSNGELWATANDFLNPEYVNMYSE